MKFEVIGFEDKDTWSQVTKGREVYYQWQYLDAFRLNGDGTPKLAYATDGKESAIEVFFLRDINKDLNLNLKEQYYDIVTPYGYGGVDYDGSNTELLRFFFDQFDEYCRENGIVSEFVRLCPFTGNQKNYSNNDSYELKKLSKTVHLRLDNPEQIWDDMEGRCRRTIKKALRNNLVVKSGFSREMLDEFKYIYNETMTRDNADDYYFFDDCFFDSILNNLGDYSRIYTVYLDGKPISSTIAMYGGKNAHYHLSGTLSDYMTLGANSLGIYEIALDLCKEGYKTLHLGGGYGGDDMSPLLQFKRSFNKYGDWDFYIAKKIIDNDAYNEICSAVGVKDLTGYFPAYRKSK